ncbi:hypothetical protein B0H16DRAFT_1658606 [Mycena metata]|uniref:peptidylprolyl isomerase n=1 Tax=Mycena metata TaxID=1033252 RepID=A0AAD7P128_9AGAR|nr:hypothetical protein B0H16DRAFT_1658606 [Mycena metata]
MASIGVWSCSVGPKEALTLETPAAIRITNIALGDVLADSSARTSLKLTYNALIKDDGEDDEPAEQPTLSTFICALTPGKIEQFSTTLVLEDKEEYVFEVVGPNTLYLTGNYIDDMPPDMPPFDDDSDMDSEDAFDLQDVSSDVEMDPNDLDDDARFEEIDEAVHGSAKKRGRESDAGEADKLSKKQKAESGKAVKPDAADASDKKEKKKDKKEKKKDKETPVKTDGEKAEKKPAAEREVAGGVKIKDTKVGTGPAAKKGNTVSMRYIGKLQSGKVFDSNTKGKPFTFHLGKGEVIKGWDEGIVGMHVGGERLLTIPAAMGYGKRGTDGIPGNSTLIFEVKLTDLK